jgi:hypothetical protein
VKRLRTSLTIDPDRSYGGLLLLSHREGLSTTVSLAGPPPSTLEKHLGQNLLGTVRRHVCFGATTLGEAIKRGAERESGGAAQRLYFSVYPDMHSVTSAAMLLSDFEDYVAHARDCDPAVTSFLPMFPNYEPASQEAFARDYWAFMQRISDLSLLTHDWPRLTPSDPALPGFRLSIGGELIFTTTMHAHSGRFSRKSAFPCWVLNLERQFEALRADGRLEKWRAGIRRADAARDPSNQPNPLMADRDVTSAALQLAGSSVEPCPFEVRLHKQDLAARVRGLLQAAYDEKAPEVVLELIRARLAPLERGALRLAQDG